ncbi:ComEC/Rec2 family competence protein [Kaistella palustris]|uniref:ComEC/Rec2 family competence protein n=1 Tax=Kaistella palustris TaxID=493376 RepID=UPI0012EBFC97
MLSLSFLLLAMFFIKNFYVYKFRHISLLLLFFSLGVFGHYLKSQKPQLPLLDNKENIIFEIRRKLNSNEKNRKYEVNAWKGEEAFQTVLSVPKSEVEFDFKHFYKAEVFINKTEKPYSDFQFDYGKYLARKDIYFQCYLPGEVKIFEKANLTFAEKIRQKRLELLKKIDVTPLSKQTREFTKGIILADRTEMDKETVQDFSRSGLVHILAISGSHIAIIFWVILLVLNPVFPQKFRNFKIVIALILIWSFAVFINYGNSVVRSCIMITCYYIYILLQRKPDLLHSMALAAFVVLIADTNQLFEVGFQLSFLAVFGIFWLNQPLLRFLPRPKNNFQNFLVNIVTVSISAQIATLPLVLYYFHQYSFISIIANLAIIPFSELLIVFALLMTVITEFSLHFAVLFEIYDFCVTATLKVIHFFAAIDFAFYQLIPMTLLEVVVAFGIVFYLRSALVKLNIKHGVRLLYFILMFISLRILLTYRAGMLEEVLEHQYFKEKIISVKSKEEIRFVLKQKAPQEKVQKYVIEPYLTSRRTKNFKIIVVPDEADSVKINGRNYRFE